MKPLDYSTTTFRFSYKKPTDHDLPNFRTRDRSFKFDKVNLLSVANASDKLVTGYESNRQLWDGTTWRTEKN